MNEEEFEKELKINDENWLKEIERLRGVDQEKIRILTNKILKAIEFCNYLLEYNEVVINGKTYIKQNGDDIITNAIKSKLLGGDE